LLTFKFSLQRDGDPGGWEDKITHRFMRRRPHLLANLWFKAL